MTFRTTSAFLLTGFAVGLAACVTTAPPPVYGTTQPGYQEPAYQEPAETNAQIANPASEYCVQAGGSLTIVADERGEFGMCLLDGVECEEWAFYRGECAPPSYNAGPSPAVTRCEGAGGNIVINDGVGGGGAVAVCAGPNGASIFIDAPGDDDETWMGAGFDDDFDDDSDF